MKNPIKESINFDNNISGNMLHKRLIIATAGGDGTFMYLV